jgi:peptidoglycan/LPS O-acetylase OafA/YrhL
MLTHLGLFEILPHNDFVKDRFYQIISGGTGVRIFFTLSGFLITIILLIEYQKFNRINFKFFFARRFLRLLPPLILFYLTIAILMNYRMIQTTSTGFMLSFFYLYNFVPTKHYTGELGHTWSLALEEQFYLIWPFVINYIKQHRGVFFLIYSIIILCVLATFIYPHLEVSKYYYTSRWFIPAIAPVLIGSYFSVLNYISSTKFESIARKEALMILVGFLLFLFPLYSPFLPLSFLFQSVGIALVLVWIVHHQTSKITELLDNKLLSYIGRISYGLYVYQGLFLKTGPGGGLWIQQFPQNIILTFVTAMVSYHLVEKPVLLLKRKFRNGSTN